MKMKSLAVLLAMIALFGGLAFADKTVIQFMSPLSGSDGGYMDQIIQGFNKANPDIEVQHVVVGNSVEYKQKLSTGLTTNSAPQVLLIRKFDLAMYLDQVTPFSAADFKGYGIDIGDVFPNLLTGLTTKDSKYLGIPLDVWIFYQAYNKANFKKAGLDPTKPPTNRAEFEKDMIALEKVTPEGITPYYEDLTWSWAWVNFFWQMGGDLLTPDFKKPAFQKAGVEACKMLLDWQAKGIVPKAKVDAGPVFQGGQSSFICTGIWTINPWADALKGDFGYAVAPQVGTVKAVFGGSHIIALPTVMNKDPKVKAASMKWVKYLWDHMIDWYAAGQTPSRKSIASSPELKAKLPMIYAVAQQLQYVKSFQMFPYISECLDAIAVNLEDILMTHKLTPEAGMDKAAVDVQRILDDYWAAQK
jgi:multiple sugar transport system substrate-binding protein